MRHAGIDLHTRDLTVTTVDAAGQPVKTARLRTTRAAVTQYFAALGPEQRAVVESTATWYWLADLLREQGVGLTLGHSQYIQAIRDATVKTDAVDAAPLAQRLRSDLIPAAHMSSPALRASRDLLRQRLVLAAPTARARREAHARPRTPSRACSPSTTSRRPPSCPRCPASSVRCMPSSAYS